MIPEGNDMSLVRSRTVHLVAFALLVLGGSRVFVAAGAEQADSQYQLIQNPLKFPEGRGTGFIMGIDVDRNGKDIWVLDTCGGDLGTCVTSKVDPIQKFDASGKFLKSMGSGLLAQPHGLYIDRGGNIWIID